MPAEIISWYPLLLDFLIVIYMRWKNLESSEPWLFRFCVNRHLNICKINSANKFIFHFCQFIFINLILRSPHYLHMKVLRERFSKWDQWDVYHKRFSRYLHLNFEKELIFYEDFSLMKFQKVGTKSLISEISKLLFK